VDAIAGLYFCFFSAALDNLRFGDSVLIEVFIMLNSDFLMALGLPNNCVSKSLLGTEVHYEFSTKFAAQEFLALCPEEAFLIEGNCVIEDLKAYWVAIPVIYVE
jgi:hypothetical protein